MNIDTKRLAKDRAYWDEVAPEGATHWDTLVHVFCNVCGWWQGARRHDLLGQDGLGTERYVVRPEQWIDGLPPVGAECELHNDEGLGVSYGSHVIGERVTVMAVFKAGAVDVDVAAVEHDGACYCFRVSMLRPIRTQAQREREEVVDFAARAYLSRRLESDPKLSGDQARKISAFFYDAGMLRMAGE